MPCGFPRPDAPLPPRSHATDLTNDELLLLDFAFTPFCMTISQLYTEGYSFHMNTAYSHSLSDQQVDETINRLASEGLIEKFDNDEEDEVATFWTNAIQCNLTERGMNLWELERLPFWDRFIHHSWDSHSYLPEQLKGVCQEFNKNGEENWISYFASPMLSMVEQYTDVCAYGRQPNSKPPEPIHLVRPNYDEFPGKVFPEMHCLYFPHFTPQSPPVFDRAEYERLCIWWESPNDLFRLHQELHTFE